MNELDLVVFDLVGTTIQDRGEVPNALQDAFLAHGLQIGLADVRRFRGLSKRELIQHLLAEQTATVARDLEAKADAVYQDFENRLLRVFGEDGVHPVEGATATFAWLKSKGVKVVLSTGLNRKITDRVLDQPDWGSGLIDASVCLDDVSQGRPAPYLIFRAMQKVGATSVHRVAAVGDTRSDLQAAYNAGVSVAIGVLSGGHSREELSAEPHTALVDSVATLPTLWSSDLS